MDYDIYALLSKRIKGVASGIKSISFENGILKFTTNDNIVINVTVPNMHTHSNQAILDKLNVVDGKLYYDGVLIDGHEHSNKTTLDGITNEKVTKWDNKSDFSGNYNDLSGKPAEFKPSSHRHDASEIDNLPTGGGGSSVSVVDNLTSTSTTSALSANQGRVIKSSLDSIVTRVNNLESAGTGGENEIFIGNTEPTNASILIWLDTTGDTLEPSDTYGQIVLSKTSININEGLGDTFTVALSQAPANTQIVTLSSNNSDATLSLSSLTFTTLNWNVAQTVTVNVIKDSDTSNETCTITLSSPYVTSKSITINITDVDETQEPSADIVTDGLMLWLDARDESGNSTTWNDRSGNGYNATLKNFTFDSNNGWINNSLKNGTGTTSIVEIPIPVTYKNGATIEVYFKATTVAGYLFADMNGNTNSPFYWELGGGVFGGGSSTVNCPMTAGAKLHSLFAIDSETGVSNIMNMVTAYSNSVMQSGSQSLSINGGTKQSFTLFNRLDTQRVWKGEIYSFRIYNRKLTEAEILKNYNYEISITRG